MLKTIAKNASICLYGIIGGLLIWGTVFNLAGILEFKSQGWKITGVEMHLPSWVKVNDDPCKTPGRRSLEEWVDCYPVDR